MQWCAQSAVCGLASRAPARHPKHDKLTCRALHTAPHRLKCSILRLREGHRTDSYLLVHKISWDVGGCNKCQGAAYVRAEVPSIKRREWLEEMPGAGGGHAGVYSPCAPYCPWRAS
jgi:hypothetical protein